MQKVIENRSTPIKLLFLMITALTLFTYCLQFISSGLDITDTGYNLANQMAFLLGWPEYSFGALWFSDFIGAMWLSLFEIKGLYQASLGWCVLVALLGVLTWQFLKDWTSPFWACLISVLVGICMIPGRIPVFYYTNIGGALLLAAAFVFYQIINKSSFPRILFYGLIMAAAVAARFPNLLAALSFPFIFVFVHFLTYRKFSKKNLKTAFACLIAPVPFLGLYLISIVLMGQWQEFTENFGILLGTSNKVPVQHEHRISFLLGIYWKHFVWKFWQGILLTFLFLASLATLKFQTNKKWILGLIALALFIANGFTENFIISWNENDLRVIVGKLALFLSLLQIIALLLNPFQFSDSKRNNYLSILLIFLSSSLIVFTGSNVGLINMSKGLWLLFAWLMISSAPILFNLKNSGRSLFLILVFLFPLAFKTAVIRWNSPYRDYPLRSILVQEMDHPKLKGVATTTSRAKSFGDFLKKAEELIEPGDYVLAYNNIPIMHFLLDAKPWLLYNWPGIQGKKAVEYLLEKPNSNELPKIILRALTNTESAQWGNGKIIPPHNPIHHEGVSAIDQRIQIWGYKILWRNSDFVILGR